MNKRWQRLLLFPLTFSAAVIVILEDWLWDDLARWIGYLGRLPVFRQIETLIQKAPPPLALSLFILPSLLLIPVKLAALWFISKGHAIWGISVMVSAKIAGTALVARLFTLTKDKLLTIRWFAFLYEKVVVFKKKVYDTIKLSTVYITLHAKILSLKEKLRTWKQKKKSWLRQKWQAILRWRRQKSDIT